MLMSLPAIFSLRNNHKNFDNENLLGILVELTLLPVDLLFVIFNFSQLKTVLSLRNLCPHFIDIFNNPITLKYLQQKAQQETKLDTDNYTLDNLIRVSLLDHTFNICLWDHYLFMIKSDNLPYYRKLHHNEPWKQMHIPSGKYKQITTGYSDAADYVMILNNSGQIYQMNRKKFSWFACGSLQMFIIRKISHLLCNTLLLTECGKIISIDIKNDLNEVKIPLSGNKIIDVSSGLGHSLLLCDNGTVYSFGNNAYKQAGHNDSYEISNPVLIPNLYNVIKIICYNNHSLLLTKDGLVYGFGDNHYCQLGFNDFVSARCPTLLPELKDIIQISTGHYHSLALRNDGKVYGFGSNYHGQLGNSQHEVVSVPTLIKNIENVRGICVSENKSFFIMQNADIIQMMDNKLVLIGSMDN
jgi:alpha-tubulin suppressor-like RCC1 family protein